MTLKKKTVQAFNYSGRLLYNYTDTRDTFHIAREKLYEVINEQKIYFTDREKDIIVYRFEENNYKVIMVISAVDEEGRAKLHQLWLILWTAFFGGVIIAFAGGYVFSKQLLKPVRKIADEVNEISARDFGRRIDTGKAKDEWNYLANTLNQLLGRLQESFETQRRFVSNASHELSTPLTSISSQLEVSLQRDREATDYRKVMRSVYQDVRQMNKLTQTLLEFAKASGTGGGLEIDLVRMDEILLRMPAEMVKANDHYSVALVFDELPAEEEQLLVYGNEALLFLAIKNIVVNACKYSPDHKATIRFTVIQSELIVAIMNNGAGIPPEEMNNIFQPFYRVHDNLSNPGFGLGLPLANQIIKLHKGHIQVQSVLDGGATFTIIFQAAGYVNADF
jgi:signal transduction histidine kinase